MNNSCNNNQYMNNSSKNISIYTEISYDGDIDDSGHRNGYGVHNWPNGTVYRGDFKDGSRNGFGVMKWVNGTVYIGEWFNGSRHGKGLIKSKSGRIYLGDWFYGTLLNYNVMNFYNENLHEKDSVNANCIRLLKTITL